MNSKVGLNGAASNSNSVNMVGFCNTCGKKSQCKCERCGDFYCSIECQRKDWPSHKYICIPMPKLVVVGQDSVMDGDMPNISTTPTHSVQHKNSSNTKSSPKEENSTKQLPNGSCVFLESFKSSNRCFVRSTSPSVVSMRESILQQIDDFGKRSSAFTASNAKRISEAMALRNGRWCRVRILKHRENRCTIIFTDFGDKDTKPLAELRKIDKSISNLPCHLQMVFLRGMSDYNSVEKSINLLNQFTKKEYKIQYCGQDSNGGNVELFKWGTSISLNSIIQELFTNDKKNINNMSAVSSTHSVQGERTRLSPKDKKVKIDESSSGSSSEKTNKVNKVSEQSQKEKPPVKEEIGSNGVVTAKPQSKKEGSEPHQIQKPCLIPPFEIVPINEKDQGSQIWIVDNSFIGIGFVGSILEKYCENLKAITEFLHKYEIDDKPYKPKMNEYCLAQFENMWYRAKVDEILSDDKFMVVYIDFTNERELSSDSIRPYPLSLDLACCTTLCAIDGLPDDLSTELKEFLEEELIPFSVLKIDNIRKEDNVCYLKSNALLKKLRDAKLL